MTTQKRNIPTFGKTELLPKLAKNLSEKEVFELVHELQLNQIELEAQNKELKSMQIRLEEVRDQYTDLFDFAPIGYFILDKKGIILNVNLTGCSILGYDRTYLKGKPAAAFHDNNIENSANFFKHLKAVFGSATLQTCTLTMKRKGGEIISVQLDSIIEVCDITGETCCRTIVKDITKEKKTAELEHLNYELKIEKERAQQYLQQSGVFFMTLDLQGCITMINQTGCEILKKKCNNENKKCFNSVSGTCSLEGKNWFENFIPENERQGIINYFKNFISGKSTEFKQIECPVVTFYTNERIISWKNTIIKDRSGKISGVLSSGHDVTDRKIAEKAVLESEKMFRTLFETAAESIIIFNNNEEIVAINQITKSLFGYQQEELIGQSIEQIIPQHLRSKHLDLRGKYFNTVKNSQLKMNVDLFGQHKNGKQFPIEISLSSIINDSELLGMALITDITERKISQKKMKTLNLELEKKVMERTQELRESQHMYKLIARNFPNGVIIVLDDKLNYVFVDGMEMCIKGIMGNNVVGTNFLFGINPEYKKSVKEKLLSVLNGKKTNFELIIEQQYYAINAVPINAIQDEKSHLLMVIQNITSLKQAEEDTKQSLFKERQLNELKTRFVSIASHEFRTPLTAIMNSVSILSKYVGVPNMEETKMKYICTINRSIKNLTTILNDFLSLDKLEGDKVELNYSKFNLVDFSQEIIESIKVITKNGQQIFYSHEGETQVISDGQMLKNIYNNLLSNAIKYSPENSIIEVETMVEKTSFTVVIKDKGIGIPKKEQKQIFERFFRTKEALNTQGTGLGLNIVKKYLEIAGGEIHFTSAYKKGTTFTIKLPTINNKSIINQ